MGIDWLLGAALYLSAFMDGHTAYKAGTDYSRLPASSRGLFSARVGLIIRDIDKIFTAAEVICFAYLETQGKERRNIEKSGVVGHLDPPGGRSPKEEDLVVFTAAEAPRK